MFFGWERGFGLGGCVGWILLVFSSWGLFWVIGVEIWCFSGEFFCMYGFDVVIYWSVFWVIRRGGFVVTLALCGCFAYR